MVEYLIEILPSPGFQNKKGKVEVFIMLLYILRPKSKSRSDIGRVRKLHCFIFNPHKQLHIITLVYIFFTQVEYFL